MRQLKSLVAALLSMIAGCHTYIPVQVTVLHYGNPVPNASVSASYAFFLDYFHPDTYPRTTDAYGRAVVPLDIDPRTKQISPTRPYGGMSVSTEPYLVADVADEFTGPALPTAADVKGAIDQAGGNLKRVQPIPITLNFLTMDEWKQKYKPSGTSTVSQSMDEGH